MEKKFQKFRLSTAANKGLSNGDGPAIVLLTSICADPTGLIFPSGHLTRTDGLGVSWPALSKPNDTPQECIGARQRLAQG